MCRKLVYRYFEFTIFINPIQHVVFFLPILHGGGLEKPIPMISATNSRNQDATGIKFLTGTGTGIYYFFLTGTGISLRKIDRYRNRNRYEEYIFTPL